MLDENGGCRIVVACSKEYAISLSFGSVHFSPPKQIPKGLHTLLVVSLQTP